MNKSHVLIVLFMILLSASPASAETKIIRSITLVNNGIAPADIWVNGIYQGYVPANDARHVDQVGILGRDGKDYGGWNFTTKDVEVRICQCRKSGASYLSKLTIPVSYGTYMGDSKHPIVWFGEQSLGKQPDFSVAENSAKPIEKAVEGDDCGTAQQGKAKSNVEEDDSGEWIIRYIFPSSGSGGIEDWNMKPDGSLVVINSGQVWTGQWSRQGGSYTAYYGSGGRPQYREWWQTKNGTASGRGLTAGGEPFLITGKRKSN